MKYNGLFFLLCFTLLVSLICSVALDANKLIGFLIIGFLVALVVGEEFIRAEESQQCNKADDVKG